MSSFKTLYSKKRVKGENKYTNVSKQHAILFIGLFLQNCEGWQWLHVDDIFKWWSSMPVWGGSSFADAIKVLTGNIE